VKSNTSLVICAHLPQVSEQQPAVGVRIAPNALGVLPGEALAGAPFAALNRVPHRLLRGQAELPREHRGDPFALRLHDRE
jgi:hypothetical protein